MPDDALLEACGHAFAAIEDSGRATDAVPESREMPWLRAAVTEPARMRDTRLTLRIALPCPRSPMVTSGTGRLPREHCGVVILYLLPFLHSARVALLQRPLT